MYIRKLYEPEKKHLLQIPGHGTASTGGSTQQEVYTRPSQPRQTAGISTPERSYTTKSGLPPLYTPEENPWLSRGAFRDGYQFGDLARGITGTMLDTTGNVFAGAARIGETAIDSLAGRVAGMGLFEDELSEFVTRDLINEEAVGGVLARNSLPGLVGTLFGADPERDSFLGEKGDSLAQSAGQYVFTRGLNSIGIPGEAVSGVISHGSEMEHALLNGATPREANVSALISALGEVGTEKLSGTIKFGGKAADDVLVDYLTDRISGKLWKTLTKAGLGGIGEGNEEIVSEMINRFGQWITYQDDKTLQEMLFSGDAREAYLDSFLGGFALGAPAGVAKALLPEGDSGTPKKTQGKPVQNQTTGPNTDAQLTQPEATTPGETGKPTTASRPADTLQRVLLTEGDTPMDSGANPGITPDTARGNPDMVPVKPETAPQIQPEMEKPDIAQDVPKTRTGAPRLTTDLRTEADVNTDTDSAVTPVSYEDALRGYLGKGMEPATVLDTGPDAEPSIPQEAAPKTKEQLISELAPKIQKTGITSGKATIAAEQMYAEAEKWYGSNADTVLEMLQPGQDPSKFLDGFRNAYLSGKMGSRAALENSTAAVYLTEEQRNNAFELGAYQKGATELLSTGGRLYGRNTSQKEYIPRGSLAKPEKSATIIDSRIRIPVKKLQALSLPQQTEELNTLLFGYTNKESHWKGKTIITPVDQLRGVVGKKHWDCSIELREDAGIKTVIHELLHARSASKYKELAYSRWKNIEEASVELFAREICKKNGIAYDESYSTIIAPLERIRNILNLYEDPYDFAKNLFETDLLERYDWLRKKADLLISRGVLREHNVRILNEAIDVFKRKVG